MIFSIINLNFIHCHYWRGQSIGDIIHLYGFYPDNGADQNQRPPSQHRPTYKPSYTYVGSATPVYPTTRPTWDHENNHISNVVAPVASPYYPPVNHHNHRPDSHFGQTDDLVYGAEADAIYSSNNQFGSNNGYSADEDDNYRPVSGIVHHFY